MKKTVTWVLYILMGVQIALGFAWAVTNFSAVQQFQENMDAFLPRTLPSKVTSAAVSFSQLILAGVSTWYFLGEVGFRKNKYVRGYACAYLLTVPCILQMHLARLAWSPALSAFLWLSGLLLQCMKSGLSRRRCAALAAAYVCYGIVCPDGLWLGLVLLLAAPMCCRRTFFGGRRGGFPCFGAAAVLAACIIFAANGTLNDGFPEGRSVYRENAAGAALVSRFVWPNLGKSYYFWPAEVKEILSEGEADAISLRADLVARDFYLRLENAYGGKKAFEMCLEMAKVCLKHRTRETVEEILADFSDYLLLPFTIEKNLRGEGVSMTAWNYGRMREHTPILVKYYYRYGLFALPFLLLGSLLLRGFRKIDRAGWFLLFAFFVNAAWHTMASNVPIDYKQALPILFVWHLAAVWELGERETG